MRGDPRQAIKSRNLKNPSIIIDQLSKFFLKHTQQLANS